MPSGFQTAGLDLDTLIKARSSAKRADIGLQTSGTDDSNRWEKSGGVGDQVTIDTGYKSGGVDLKNLFQDANYGGPLSAYATNSTPSGGNIGTGPFTSASTTIVAGGGTPGYTYSWARQSGDATIGISSAVSSSPTWSVTGTQGTSKSAVWRCTVTDALSNTTTVDVTVTLNFYNALSVGLDKGSVSGSGTGDGPFTTDIVTGSPTGGSGGYVYLWEHVSGDSVTTNSSTSIATSFTGAATAPASLAGVYRLKVTDSLGNTSYSSNVPVGLTFSSATLMAATDKGSVSGSTSGAGYATTDTVTVAPTGGTPSYGYFWERVTGDASVFVTSGSSAATNFGRYSATADLYTAQWRCRVTDSLGAIVYTSNVIVQLLFNP